MAQQKGQTGNPNGRPKGSKNKVTKEIKNFATSFIEGRQEQFEKDYDSLEPLERVKIFEKIMQYVIPKAVKIETDEQKTITIEDKLKELSKTD